MTPIRDVVATVMLCLRRRYLERQIDGPFDPILSLELDAMIAKEEK
jgi:hypothetical protein